MIIREATIADIPALQLVRNSVHENALSDPALVPDAAYVTYLTQWGKGWLCETDNKVVGFAIADIEHNNVWALFLLPEYEKRGIGSMLHDTMLRWYFEQTDKPIWLSTAPGTRAAGFYRAAGWKETGTYGKGEIKFELERFPAI